MPPNQMPQPPPQQQPVQQQPAYSPPPAGPSNRNRVLKLVAIIGGGLTVLIIILSLLLSSSDPLEEDMALLFARQQEIIRVSDLALDSRVATTRSTSLAAQTRVVVQSDNIKLTEIYTSAYGKRPDPLLLGSLMNEETDERLETAALNNRFDAVFNEILVDQLDDANQRLASLFEQSQNEITKQALSEAFDNNKILLEAAQK